MDRSTSTWAPLTGVGFFVVGIISFAIGGEPESADKGAAKVVKFYVDNKDSVQIGAAISVLAGFLLIFFGAYLRRVLREAAGGREGLSLVAFLGLVIVAVAFAIDATLTFSMAEAAGDVNPVAVQALQALWDNDFLPIVLGVEAFLWATGLLVLRTGVLPKWLGWVMIVLGVLGFTPIGFVSAIGSALLVLAMSIIFTLRERSSAPPAAPAEPAST